MFLSSSLTTRNQDTPVPTKYEKPFKSRHIFKLHETKFLCEEVLYVSSGTHPSGYKVGHKDNKGKKHTGPNPHGSATLIDRCK